MLLNIPIYHPLENPTHLTLMLFQVTMLNQQYIIDNFEKEMIKSTKVVAVVRNRQRMWVTEELRYFVWPNLCHEEKEKER